MWQLEGRVNIWIFGVKHQLYSISVIAGVDTQYLLLVINLSFKFGILEKLNAGEVLVGDGGMTHALEKRGYVKAGPYTPECTVEYPDAGCSLLLLHHRPQLWGLITTSLL